MDRYVADPQWHDLIIWYFFLGGIAAGSSAFASLARLYGGEPGRRATRVADYLAFPLVTICGLLLVVDLGRPERFWHMLIGSETLRPMFKWWSPMSVGSWGLSIFGTFAALSFFGVLIEDGLVGSERIRSMTLRLRRGAFGRIAAFGELGSAFFLGSYTGVLLEVTNQPVWSDSTWIGALFLASSGSTGIAALMLLTRAIDRNADPEWLERLETLDLWAVGSEAVLLLAFACSLGTNAWPGFRYWPGIVIPVVVVPLGILAPIVLKYVRRPWASIAASVSILIAGFALRAAVVGMPGIFRVGG